MSPRAARITAFGLLRVPSLFTVEGSGEFPYDMLRYDHCWPFSEALDSPALKAHRYDRRRVVLATNSPSAPTAGRWKSFGWLLLDIVELR